MPTSRPPHGMPGDPAANGHGHWSNNGHSSRNGHVAVLGDDDWPASARVRDDDTQPDLKLRVDDLHVDDFPVDDRQVDDLRVDDFEGDLDDDREPVVPLEVERQELERLRRLGGFAPDLDDRPDDVSGDGLDDAPTTGWPAPGSRTVPRVDPDVRAYHGYPARPGRPAYPGRPARPTTPARPAHPAQAPEGVPSGAEPQPEPELEAPARRLPGRVATLVVFVVIVMLATVVVTAIRPPGDSGAAAAPGTPDARPDIVRHWNAVALQTLGEDGTAPAVAARALAILHASTYDAWAAYDGQAVGTRLGDQLRRPISERTDANKQEAVSYAAFTALTDLFGDQARQLEAELRHLGYDPAAGEADASGGAAEPEAPAAVGRAAAAAVLDVRHHDGANQLGDLAPGAYADYTGYQPVNEPDGVGDPSRWQPLSLPRGRGEPAAQRFDTPHWARVTPFALAAADQFRPAGPPAIGSSDRQLEIAEVTRLSAELDDHGKAIVEFWADATGADTPAAQWSRFGQWVSQRDQLSMDDEVKLFFALANAGLDATIVASDAKLTFDSARPVTVIGAGLGGTQIEAWAGPYQVTRWIQARDWRPYQPATSVTPPSPEYVSAHSAVSAASAAVLRSFTGTDAFGATATVAAGDSTVEPGVVPHADIPLSWATFTDAVHEAGFSRLLAGTQFRSAVEDGRVAGDLAGAQAWAKAQALFDGTAVVNPV